MTTEPCLDAATLEKLLQIGGEEFAVQMIELFLSFIPQKLAEARSAWQDGDMLRLQKAVHPIKSSTSSIGAHKMRNLAEQIEQYALNKRSAQITPLLSELETAFDQVKAHLQECRKNLAV